jgi:hypothetical protein
LPCVVSYLRALTAPRMLLWCYFVWWAFVAARYFDPQPSLWLNSLGLSGIIGTGLYFSTAYAGPTRRVLGFWPVLRFYLMPFCVSSFAALIKGRGFVLIFHPDLKGNLQPLAFCAGASALVLFFKRSRPLPAVQFE